MNKLKEMEASLNVQERKRRTRRFIELRGLVSKAHLDTWDSNTLLGAFLFLKEKEHESEKNGKFIEEWTRKGGAAFAAEKEKILSSSKQKKESLSSLNLKLNPLQKSKLL